MTSLVIPNDALDEFVDMLVDIAARRLREGRPLVERKKDFHSRGHVAPDKTTPRHWGTRRVEE